MVTRKIKTIQEHPTRRLWQVTFGLGLMMALFLAVACSSSEPEPTQVPASSAEPTAQAQPTTSPAPTQPPAPSANIGGEVILGLTHPTTLMPSISPVSLDLYTAPLFFNGLTQPGDELEPLPDLAESWDVSSDGLMYTFHLKNGVKWHDGQPFTADDVKFTWEAICDPGNARGRQLCGFFSRVVGALDYMEGNAPEITGVKALDDQTIQVELSAVYAPFLSLAAGQMIVPKHIWENVPAQEFGSHPAARGDGTIGTGPFIVESWTSNESIIANANLDYHEGRPKIDKLIIRQCASGPAEAAARFTQLKVGELNGMGLFCALALDFVEEAESDPNLMVRSVTGLSNMYVEFNLRNPLFQDVLVRKAISYATNREELAEDLWLGRSEFVNAPIHPQFAWAINPDTPVFDNDVDKALELFAEAGWTLGSDGILEKDGQKFSFTMQTIQQNYPTVLQQQWKRAGIDMQIELMDFGSFWGPIFLAHKHEVAGLNLPYGLYTDPEFPMGGYFISDRNRSGWVNARSDELIDLATRTLDPLERQKLYYELEDLMADEVPNLWLGIPNEHWVFTKGLNVPTKRTGYLTIRSINEWFWEN